MEFIVNCYNKIDLKLSWEGKMVKRIRKTAIVMLLCVYFLTYGVLPQVEAGKDTPVIVVAHRAGAKVAPENTLAALKQAIRDGAPIAEIDVQQLSDGTLIVMHDSNFKRTAGEDVCVWDAEADVLSALEVGSAFSAAYRGEQIPTLEEMLACAGGRITLMIELKYTGQEQELEENVLALLQEYDMMDECIIGSMNKGILQRNRTSPRYILPMIWERMTMIWIMRTAIVSKEKILQQTWWKPSITKENMYMAGQPTPPVPCGRS